MTQKRSLCLSSGLSVHSRVTANPREPQGGRLTGDARNVLESCTFCTRLFGFVGGLLFSVLFSYGLTRILKMEATSLRACPTVTKGEEEFW